MTQKLFLAVLFLTLSFGAFAQNSTIVGKVIDEKNAEVLIGAVVQIKGTTYGSSTDLNGEFVIKGVPVGTYTLIGSYLSYETKEIAELVVKANEPTTINIALKKISKNLR